MKTLILTVGGSEKPIIKSIKEVKPDKIFFISTKKSSPTINKLNLKNNYKIFEINNENDLSEAFKISSKAYNEIERGEIFVDYTGGTKNMSVGLSLATFGKGIKYIYIGGKERTKGGVGTVKSGTEECINNIDPAEIYSINISKKIENFFNKGKYKLVYDILNEDIANNITISTFGIIKQLSYSLYLWESQAYQQAFEEFNKFIKTNNSNPLFKIEFNNEFKNHLKTCTDKKSNGLIEDMIANAERRHQNGEHTEAVLRIYRIIEYIGQKEFEKEFGCKTDNIDKDKIKERVAIKSNKEINETIESLKGNTGGQQKTYKLLSFINNELGKGYMNKECEFNKFGNARNYSYLAHGFKILEEKHVIKGFELIRILYNYSNIKINPPQIKFKLSF